MSIFNQEADRKSRVLRNLREAITAIEEGRITILEEVMVNAHSDGMGYTKHGKDHDSMFFGFEFCYSATKPRAAVAPIVMTTSPTECTEASSLSSPETCKLSNSQLQRLCSNGQYTCSKCGKFSTTSGTGMKKHYNRCDG